MYENKTIRTKQIVVIALVVVILVASITMSSIAVVTQTPNHLIQENDSVISIGGGTTSSVQIGGVDEGIHLDSSGIKIGGVDEGIHLDSSGIKIGAVDEGIHLDSSGIKIGGDSIVVHRTGDAMSLTTRDMVEISDPVKLNSTLVIGGDGANWKVGIDYSETGHPLKIARTDFGAAGDSVVCNRDRSVSLTTLAEEGKPDLLLLVDQDGKVKKSGVTIDGNDAISNVTHVQFYPTGKDNFSITQNATPPNWGTANYNIAFGDDVMLNKTIDSGDGNIGIGSTALYNLTDGGLNTIIGMDSGLDITTGSRNTGIGWKCNPSATGSTALGSETTCSGTNSAVIGRQSTCSTDNTIVLGNTSVTSTVPGGDGVQDLGSGTKQFKDLYLSGSVDMSSTTSAFKPPRLTTTQRIALTAPSVGDVVFDTDLGVLMSYDNGGWKHLDMTTNNEWPREPLTDFTSNPPFVVSQSGQEGPIAAGWRCFNKMWSATEPGDDERGWVADGAVISPTTISGTGPVGREWIQIDMGQQVEITHFKAYAKGWDLTAKDFYIVGSNEDGTTDWVNLYYAEDPWERVAEIDGDTSLQFRRAEADFTTPGSYRYYRFVAVSNFINNYGSVTLQELRLFSARETGTDKLQDLNVRDTYVEGDLSVTGSINCKGGVVASNLDVEGDLSVT
jgi:hypothetical protein